MRDPGAAASREVATLETARWLKLLDLRRTNAVGAALLPAGVPETFDELIKVFGDPRPHLAGVRGPGPAWERQILAPADLPGPLLVPWTGTYVRRVWLHRRIVPAFRGALGDLVLLDLWRHLREWGGAYAFRRQRGGSRLSVHAWAAAVDLDVSTNRLGEQGDMRPEIVEVFEAWGFFWGGRWRRRDSQHFQWCGGGY